MKVLVLGATGMLGHAACRVLARSFEVHAAFRDADVWSAAVRAGAGTCTPHPGFDASDEAAVSALVAKVRPAAVLNCVGVVKQKAEAQDPLTSIRINALLPHVVAAASDSVGAKLVQVSTDCVFSGRRGRYTEDDVPDPEDLYGRSKLLGEVTHAPHLTVRTSIIGRQLRGTTGLLEWFRSQRGGRVRGFANAIFSGLTTTALSEVIAGILRQHSGLAGLYHVGTSPMSKEALLRRLDGRLGLGVTIDRDESFVCDRSLDSSRFRQATGLEPPGYDAMIEQLAEEERHYD